MTIIRCSENMKDKEGIISERVQTIKKKIGNLDKVLIVKKEAYGRYVVFNSDGDNVYKGTIDFYDSGYGNIGGFFDDFMLKISDLIYENDRQSKHLQDIEQLLDEFITLSINIKAFRKKLTHILEECGVRESEISNILDYKFLKIISKYESSEFLVEE